jgi:hypothetical protein
VATAEAVITTEPPAAISCIIGDCVTNLRASLDYIAWEVANKNPPRPLTDREKRDITFPTCPDAASFNSSRPVSVLRNVAPAGAVQEMEQVQPYQTGFEVLGHLADLVRVDKHRTLLVGAGFMAGMGRITLTWGGKSWYNPGGISIGTNLAGFGASSSEDLDVSATLDGEATIYVTFRDADLPRLPADLLVEAIIGCVDGLIPRFERFV